MSPRYRSVEFPKADGPGSSLNPAREANEQPTMVKVDHRQAMQEYLETRLVNPVKILIFTRRRQWWQAKDPRQIDSCTETEKIIHGVASLTDKITYEVCDVHERPELFQKYGIEFMPALVILGREDYGIRQYGIPLGYDLNFFLDTLIDISVGTPDLQQHAILALKDIQQYLNIRVFVSPTCAFCPVMAHMANQFALISSFITSTSIDAWHFRQLAQRYEVEYLPTIVINDHIKFEGARSEEVFFDYMQQAVQRSRHRWGKAREHYTC